MRRTVKTAITLLGILLAAGQAFSADFYMEAKGAYFRPLDSVFREIYGSGAAYGGELGFNFKSGIGVWMGGDYFSKTGKLTYTEEETKIRVVPLAVGIRYNFELSNLVPYVSAGLGYFQFKESNPIGTIEDSDIGFIGKIGINWRIGSMFFLDFFGSYSHCRVQPEDVEANVGGLKAGIGAGLRF